VPRGWEAGGLKRRLWGVIGRDHAKAREINVFRTIDVSTIGALRRR